QPTRSRLARARSGARSAMPTTCTPGMRGAWARYMEPNLPAPTRAIRTGRPSAARCRSLLWRLMVRGRGLTWDPGAALYRQRARPHVRSRAIAMARVSSPCGARRCWPGRRSPDSPAATAAIRHWSIDEPPSRADPPGAADRAGAWRAPHAVERPFRVEDRQVLQHVDHRSAARIRVLERPGATAGPTGLVDARKQYQPDDGLGGGINHLRRTGGADPGLYHAHRTLARHPGAGCLGVLGELPRGLGRVVPAAVVHCRFRAAISGRHGHARDIAGDLRAGRRSGQTGRRARRRGEPVVAGEARRSRRSPAAMGAVAHARTADLHRRTVTAAARLRRYRRTACRAVPGGGRAARLGHDRTVAAARRLGRGTGGRYGAAVRHA